MNKQKIEIGNLINFFHSNHLLCLVGENMSGKSTILKELRDNIDKLTNQINLFALHIDTPLNSIHLTTPTQKKSIAIRLDDLSDFIERVNAFSKKGNLDIEESYKAITARVNHTLKKNFGFVKHSDHTILTIEDSEEKEEEVDVRRHIDLILKKYLNLRDINEIEDQEPIRIFRKKVKEEIEKAIDSNFRKTPPAKRINKKFLVQYKNSEKQKLTKISSGLENLILTVFIIETVDFFNSQISSLEFYLFFDEPELYLHPTWQKQLLEYFISKANRCLKILYATHSQYIIPIQNFESIGIVRNQNNSIFFDTLKNALPKFDSSTEISIIKPVEDALGIKLDTFSHSFITVEGEEEISILNKCLIDINVNKIINLKGADNILPYVQAAKSYNKDFKGVFILDADLEIDRIISSISNKDELINQIKEHFIFVGKNLYTFDEVYGSKGYEQLKHECLEDFIANNLFESPDVGYGKIKELVKLTINAFKKDKDKEFDIDEPSLEKCLNAFNKEKTFHDIRNGCLKKISLKFDDLNISEEEKNKRNTKLREQMETNIKHRINKEAMNISNEKYQILIDKIKSKV
ncbi:MAG: AAA family ATPase [Leptospiraceae bacterium]|nr:AAA family ATPase [Leptospiraceae bacterium]